MTDQRYLAARLSRLQPTAVNRVLQEVKHAQAQGLKPVSLARGQPDTPTPAHIVEAACKALRDGRTGYPDNQGEPALRLAAAKKIQREQGISYDPECEILITDGATLGIHAALGTLANPGGWVMLPDPIYDAYSGPIATWGCEPKPIRAQVHDGRFTISRSVFKGAGNTNSESILLNTPWNPVGTVFTRKELEVVMGYAEKHDCPVVSDEIYESLVYDGRRHYSPASVSADARERTVVINSLSKTYAMTGWRIGYCAGPEAVIRGMYLILQQSSRGPATFVQDAATCALEADQECTRQMATDYQSRRDRVVDRLSGIAGIVPLVPEGGLFVMVDVRRIGRSSDEIRRFLLLEAGVVVIHGAAYGAGGEGFLRVSFAAGGEVLERGLDRLREGLSRLADEVGPL
jgi:aspartate/methionine/tyrosine aminotransferase